jgi:hypothetical protein
MINPFFLLMKNNGLQGSLHAARPENPASAKACASRFMRFAPFKRRAESATVAADK